MNSQRKVAESQSRSLLGRSDPRLNYYQILKITTASADRKVKKGGVALPHAEMGEKGPVARTGR
jgi:hypothetical protein